MKREEKLFYRFGAHILLKLTLGVALDIKIEGEENIPKKGKFLLVSNHRSWLDPILIATEIDRPINFLAASFTFYIPVIKDLYKKAGVIPLYFGEKKNERNLRKCINLLLRGEPVGAFPEGIENFLEPEGEKIKKFHTGFVRIAMASNAPVIPCAVVGKKEITQPEFINKIMRIYYPFMPPWFNPSVRLVYYGKGVRIMIGKPIDLSSYYNLMPTKELLSHIAGKIRREVVKLYEKGREKLRG